MKISRQTISAAAARASRAYGLAVSHGQSQSMARAASSRAVARAGLKSEDARRVAMAMACGHYMWQSAWMETRRFDHHAEAVHYAIAMRRRGAFLNEDFGAFVQTPATQAWAN